MARTTDEKQLHSLSSTVKFVVKIGDHKTPSSVNVWCDRSDDCDIRQVHKWAIFGLGNWKDWHREIMGNGIFNYPVAMLTPTRVCSFIDIQIVAQNLSSHFSGLGIIACFLGALTPVSQRTCDS